MISFRKILAGLPLLALVTFAVPTAEAQATGIPVIDPGNIAQTIKVVKTSMDQLNQMKAQLQQVTNLQSSLGAVGKGLASQILSNAGLNFSGTTNPFGDYANSMPGMIDALPSSSSGSTLGVTTDMAQQAKTSVTAGRNFAIQAFYKGGQASVDDMAARRGVRQAAVRDSATAGYALSVYSKNDLTANSEPMMQKLTDQVQASTDLRTDVAANTAVQLATLRQVTVTNQLLAQLLEVNSTATIANDTTTQTPTSTATAATNP